MLYSHNFHVCVAFPCVFLDDRAHLNHPRAGFSVIACYLETNTKTALVLQPLADRLGHTASLKSNVELTDDAG